MNNLNQRNTIILQYMIQFIHKYQIFVFLIRYHDVFLHFFSADDSSPNLIMIVNISVGVVIVVIVLIVIIIFCHRRR